MSIHQIIELSALISSQSDHLIESPHSMPEQALYRCWGTFRMRLTDLTRQLDRVPLHVSALPAPTRQAIWLRISPIFYDTLACEMLTRIWGAVLTARDRHQGICHGEAIARDLLILQLQARKRVLGLLVEGPACSLREVADVDGFRRKVERWTDVLLGHLVVRYGVDDFACQVDRARDFGTEHFPYGSTVAAQQAWDLLLLSLRLTFRECRLCDHLDPQSHTEVIRTILGCFPSDAFGLDGTFRSVRTARIDRSSLSPEGPPSTDLVQKYGTPLAAELLKPPHEKTGTEIANLQRGKPHAG